MIVPLNFPVICLIVLIQIKTESVITNCSNQGLNILSDIKFYFELINSEGMVILVFFVISVVNQSRKKACFFSAGAQIRNYGPFYWCHQCHLIDQVSFQNNFEDIAVQLSLGNNCILSYAQVCFFQVIYKTTQICRKDSG
jgi:hypothetical protein